MKQKKENRSGQNLYTSLLLLLVAIVCVTAATTAWLSLADNTRVHTMGLDVTAGANVRFDLDPHDTIDEYVRTLSFRDIAARIRAEKGFDPASTPLDPVTTTNYSVFTFQDGARAAVDSGSYLEFTLHFMASRDCVVHLTSENSADSRDGTLISSPAAALPAAMRISFTDGQTTYVYDPGMGNRSQTIHGAKAFGLPSWTEMVYTDDNAMFSLREGVNKPITVRIWMEGTDEDCTDALQKADYEIRLRFEATDENNNSIREDIRAKR